MFVLVELFYRTWGGEKAKEDDRALTILKYITSVQVKDIIKRIESC
jgi:hypothetical protein